LLFGERIGPVFCPDQAPFAAILCLTGSADPTLDYRPTDDGTAGVVWTNRFTIEIEVVESRRVNVPPGVQSVVRPDLKPSSSNASAAIEIFCGNPMPGTANSRWLGE
jgi:hypothetical protein